jgi:hypothetical protein
MASKEKDTRTAEQIRQDLNAARSRASQTVEDATQQFHPKTLKNDAVDDAKSFAQRQFDQAKGQVKDENGWRGDRLILVGGVVAVFHSPGPYGDSYIQHFAAGVVFAAVAAKLLPDLHDEAPIWVIVGFAIGVATMWAFSN